MQVLFDRARESVTMTAPDGARRAGLFPMNLQIYARLKEGQSRKLVLKFFGFESDAISSVVASAAFTGTSVLKRLLCPR